MRNLLLKPFRTKRKGQAMVELAMTLPIFLFLLIGIIEIARLVFIYSSVFTASRDAVRYASGVGTNTANVVFYRDCNGIIQRAISRGSIAGIDAADVVISYDHGPDNNGAIDPINAVCPVPDELKSGDRVVVSVSTLYSPIISFFGFADIPITSTSARTILSKLEIYGTPLKYSY